MTLGIDSETSLVETLPSLLSLPLFEEKGEPKQIRTEVPLLTSLTPYR